MQRYLGFGARDRELLAKIEPAFRPRLAAMIDDFYSRIFADPSAASIFDEPERVESLKRSLRNWTIRLFTGPFDASYFELRSRIGHRHVEIGLPERFMPLAMNVIRRHITDAAIEVGQGDPVATSELVSAVSKLLDLELTIMLDSYHTDSMERVVSSERTHVIQAIATGLSRELKNLLGTIHTSVLLLKKQLAIDADERQQVDRITRAARRIGDVSDHIVEFARPKRRGNQRVRVVDLFEEVLAQVGDPRGCVVETEVIPLDLEVRCSATEVARALANLVGNSIQAYLDVGRSGRVRLRATSDPNLGVEFEVADEGPGVPEERIDRIFEPLYSSREGALGLGLSFCRDVAVAHGGSIELLPGSRRGATFCFRLPRDVLGDSIKPLDAQDRAEDGR